MLKYAIGYYFKVILKIQSFYTLNTMFAILFISMLIKDLKPGMKNVSIKVKVNKKVVEKDIRSGKLAEFEVEDESGKITLVAYDEKIDLLSEGKSYELKNAFVNVFRGRKQLNIGRFGKVIEI